MKVHPCVTSTVHKNNETITAKRRDFILAANVSQVQTCHLLGRTGNWKALSSEAIQLDPCASKHLDGNCAVSMKLPSRFGFKWPSVRAWGLNSCGLDANAAARAYRWGSSLSLGGTWLSNDRAISQEWSTISPNTAEHLFSLCGSAEPRLPSSSTCGPCWGFMTCKFKGPFLLPHDKLFKG